MVIWTAVATIPQNSLPGDYWVSIINPTDRNGITAASTPNGTLEVINPNKEIDPPIISDLTIEPTSVDVTNNSVTVNISYRGVDATENNRSYSRLNLCKDYS